MTDMLTFGPAFLAAYPNFGVGVAAMLFIVTPLLALSFGYRYRRRGR